MPYCAFSILQCNIKYRQSDRATGVQKDRWWNEYRREKSKGREGAKRDEKEEVRLKILKLKFATPCKNYSHLLQNASHIPFALTGLKFFASLTSTCSEPFDDELRELADDLMLPNLRKPLPIDDLEKCDDFVSGGTNFKPTIMSPRYVARSSNGSLYKWCKIQDKRRKINENKIK